MAQRLLQMIPDIALRHRAADIERHCRRYIFCSFRSEKYPSHLRPVSMHYAYFVTAAADFRNVLTCFSDDGELLFRRGAAFSRLKSIAAERNYYALWLAAHRIFSRRVFSCAFCHRFLGRSCRLLMTKFFFFHFFIHYKSSLFTGHDIQRGPPLPLESSDDGIVSTLTPFLSSRSFVTWLRS